MQRLFILLIVLNFSTASIGQDTTIIFDNRTFFDESIGYLFRQHTDNLTSDVNMKVDSIFKKYDFTGNEFDCQYLFTFILELDSCGNIQNCKSSYRHRDNLKPLDLFMGDISSMLLNSSIQLKNYVVLKDTSFFIPYTYFEFEISCDPSEVYFYNEKVATKYPNLHLIYRNEEEEILFDGFRNGCSQ